MIKTKRCFKTCLMILRLQYEVPGCVKDDRFLSNVVTSVFLKGEGIIRSLAIIKYSLLSKRPLKMSRLLSNLLNFITCFKTHTIKYTECHKKNVLRECGYYGGAVDSIISVFTQLHRSGFNLEYETLRESI